MKKIVLFFVLLFGVSFAAKNSNALGLWIQFDNDEPWGIDYKYLLSDYVMDFYLRFPTSSDNLVLGIYGGYYKLFPVIKADASMGKFPFYAGPTVGMGFWDKNMAIRLGCTGGISYILPENTIPLDISFELNPAFEIQHFGDKNIEDGWHIPMYTRLLFHFYFF
jgi:hypothetical protein